MNRLTLFLTGAAALTLAACTGQEATDNSADNAASTENAAASQNPASTAQEGTAALDDKPADAGIAPMDTPTDMPIQDGGTPPVDGAAATGDGKPAI